MKNLNEIINEKLKLNNQSKLKRIPPFKLSDDEREDFLNILGYTTGYYGGGEEKKYAVIWNDCTKDEENILIDLYSLFNNQTDFPQITNRILDKREVYLIREICMKVQNNKDLRDEYDDTLSNIVAKIDGTYI